MPAPYCRSVLKILKDNALIFQLQADCVCLRVVAIAPSLGALLNQSANSKVNILLAFARVARQPEKPGRLLIK
jgi:hypothetical protein